jgi:hypothetical protein
MIVVEDISGVVILALRSLLSEQLDEEIWIRDVQLVWAIRTMDPVADVSRSR